MNNILLLTDILLLSQIIFFVETIHHHTFISDRPPNNLEDIVMSFLFADGASLARVRSRLIPQAGNIKISAVKPLSIVVSRRSFSSPTGYTGRKWRRPIRRAFTYSDLGVLGAAGFFAYKIYDENNPEDQAMVDPSKKAVVVLGKSRSRDKHRLPVPDQYRAQGSGWGSVSFLKSLNFSNYNVIVVSPRNYFLFTPLLPSCTTGLVDLRSLMMPMRGMLRKQKTAATFYEAEATSVDCESKTVHIRGGREDDGDGVTRAIKFDMLVMGVGAQNATFGMTACFSIPRLGGCTARIAKIYCPHSNTYYYYLFVYYINLSIAIANGYPATGAVTQMTCIMICLFISTTEATRTMCGRSCFLLLAFCR